jgi:hypothetical protein
MVVGMHRSGTSAVTRVVNLLGVPLGREDDIYSAEDNPSGHWESRALCAVNDVILRAFGGFDMAMPPMRSSWLGSRRAASLRGLMRATFADVYTDERWLWKDPRICLTLPLWRQVLTDFCVVFVVRDAEPVARSLHRRERFPIFYCHALWDDYNRRAVAAMTGLPVVRVDFDAMLQDPEQQTKLLADGLAAVGVRIDGDLDAAATSLQKSSAGERKDERALGHQLATALRSGPAVSLSFEPPPLPRQPSWMRPVLEARCVWLKAREPWTDRAFALREE